jgi:hypothetical protein
MTDIGKALMEAVVADSMYYYGICLEGLRKRMTNLRIAGAPVEIRDEYLRNTSLEMMPLHQHDTY